MSIEILESRIAPATIFVNTLADRTDRAGSHIVSLRDAINLANVNGDPSNTIKFASNVHGKMVLKLSLPPITGTGDLSIDGPGATKLTIDGARKHQIMYLGDGSKSYATISISNLTLAHGKAENGGAMTVNDYGGTVSIKGCIITGNEAAGAAGSYYTKGGAIDLEQGTLTLSKTTVSGNIAQGTPGLSGGYKGGIAQGGAIYVAQAGTLNVQTSIISGNQALGGNGMTGATGAKVRTGDGNYGAKGGYGANAYGGAIFSSGTVAVTISSTISGNTAKAGHGGNGGAGSAGGAASRAYAPGNGGAGGNGGFGGAAAGGGIQSTHALNLLIGTSTISGNTAASGLGGKAGPGGKAGRGVQIANGSSYRGAAGAPGLAGADGGSSSGGGVNSYSSYLTVRLSTIAGNTAGQGGGLNINQNMTTEIDNSTIAFNTSLVDGGGMFVTLDFASDPVNLISTAVAKNSAPTGAGQDVSGSIVADYCLIQDVTNANITPADIANDTNLTGVDPLFGTLSHNGGPTLTIVAPSNSPLVNHGSNPNHYTQDQRGYLRTVGGKTDIGAVEIA